MRIDQITELRAKCTGCLACADACPVSCIKPIVAADGFTYTVIDDAACVNCGKCYAVCPIETKHAAQSEQHLFAAYAKDKAGRNRGSSGGMFELLARHFLKQGYLVCGAAFEGTTLAHRIIRTEQELVPLLKSKYLQSNTAGIYAEIRDLLKQGERVFFCGTPCQVSALKNLVGEALAEELLTADIVCHGVPSQTMFDAYIASLSAREGGEISSYSFRVKDNRYKHEHGYSYCVAKEKGGKTVQGIYTQSSFYNAFKNYTIFRESCYDCRYATLARCSDITLADFWGIEKYGFKVKGDAGVSMVITNTARGREAFAAIAEQTVWGELAVQCGVDSNYCLTHSTKKPAKRDTAIATFAAEGYDAMVAKYAPPATGLKQRIYWAMPAALRNLLRKIRGRFH